MGYISKCEPAFYSVPNHGNMGAVLGTIAGLTAVAVEFTGFIVEAFEAVFTAIEVAGAAYELGSTVYSYFTSAETKPEKETDELGFHNRALDNIEVYDIDEVD